MNDSQFKNELMHILDNNPLQPSTPKFIKKNNIELYNWIINSTSIYNPMSFTESIYIIINGPHQNCEYNTSNIKHKFKTYAIGYSQFCSLNCICQRNNHSNFMYKENANKTPEEKLKAQQAKDETMLSRYGVKHPQQSSVVQEKTKQTNLERYGVDNPSKSKIVKEKTKQTYVNKYGVEHPRKLEEIKNKASSTNLERYGVDNPSKSPLVKAKVKATNLDRYGVETQFLLPELREKANKTRLLKYGGISAFSDNNVRTKAKTTMLNKYGVEYGFSSPELREKGKQTNLSRYGVEFASQRHIPEATIEILQNKELFADTIRNKTVFEICNLLSIAHTTVYSYVQKYDVHNLLDLNSTSYEIKIKELLEKYNIDYIRNSKSIIPPQQLDFYIPEFNLAIEPGSSYYHSELHGNRGRTYHYNKWKQCRDQNITLFQYFDNDILNKFHLIESKIKRICNVSIPIIGARKLQLLPLNDYNLESNFLNQYHLQGANTKRNLVIGAYYTNELVGLSTWYVKNSTTELSRFATNVNYSFPGLFSRMLTKFKSLTDFNGELISFSDNRHSDGNLYKSNGFNLEHVSNPGYTYSNDFINFESRQKYQKHKLAKTFNLESTYVNSKPEWEIMQEQGYDRLWDAGQTKWAKNIG